MLSSAIGCFAAFATHALYFIAPPVLELGLDWTAEIDAGRFSILEWVPAFDSIHITNLLSFRTIFSAAGRDFSER
jgi:hypothetical protein